MRRTLPQVPKKAEGLGLRTIMDRGLAVRHGLPYVHLTVFAIDVDRVRDAVEDIDDPLPFGWEVFLTEAYLVERVDAEDPLARGLIEDVVLGILEGESGEAVLGSQLPFAVWDAIERGAWPAELRAPFAGWKAKPKQLVAELGKLWDDAESHRRELARFCLETAMEPPLAAPTLEALEAMSAPS
ncbi:MAG: hypothetical protein M3Y87_26065 [Myxococcota bacterium]|nr:hypothetical protein [Myxococcota bacterium]